MANGGALKGFAVAGEDHKWYWAVGIIDGNTVLVYSKSVPAPSGGPLFTGLHSLLPTFTTAPVFPHSRSEPTIGRESLAAPNRLLERLRTPDRPCTVRRSGFSLLEVLVAPAALVALLGSHGFSDPAADRDALTRGVTALVAPGSLPGPISASGDAFVVLTAAQGKGRVPLFVGTQVERGRALAGGHEGFFSATALNNPSNGRFLANSLVWLAGKPLAGLRVGLLGMSGINPLLSKAGAVPSGLNSSTLQAALAGLDVICMTQSALDDNPSGQIAVIKFVKSGHGLLIAGPAWGWLATHPHKDLLADQSANRMLFSYGICFEDGSVGEEYTPEAADSPLLKAKGAIDGLMKRGLTLSDTATATMTVERSLEHQPVDGSPLMAQIVKLALAEPGGGVPTVKTPITNAQPFSRLKIWLDSKRYSPAATSRSPNRSISLIFSWPCLGFRSKGRFNRERRYPSPRLAWDRVVRGARGSGDG